MLLTATCPAAWEIDPSHTHVSFEGGHLGLTKTSGGFRKVSGEVKLDIEKLETSTVGITIDSDSSGLLMRSALAVIVLRVNHG
ncbi:MAG TPA: YceI family protein [Ramlibacter sp.]|nr:YceI family protein [Ramlibacter sp.]